MNLLLDSSGDIIPGRGMSRGYGVNYIAQLTKNRLLTIFGEWDLDPKIGFPWFGNSYKNAAQIGTIIGLVKATIESTKGVYGVNSLDYTIEGRTLMIQFEATSIYGTFSQEVAYGGNT